MTRHFATDDPLLAAKIMAATADMSARVERPAYHLIVSWTAAENPSRAAMEQVIATTLADLGLDQHQAVAVAHGDTDNRHVHLAINRVHPDTGVAWSTKHDYRRLERSIYNQAQAMGFIAVPGRHNTPKARRHMTSVRSRGAMMLARTKAGAIKPFKRGQVALMAPVLRDILEHAGTWQDVATRMQAVGYVIEAKGQGLTIRDAARTGHIKLSSVGVGLGRQTLEQRFGETFASFASRTPESRPLPKPLAGPLALPVPVHVPRTDPAEPEPQR